jgi:hypothetical protein
MNETHPISWQKTSLVLLFLITLAITIVSLIGEAFKTHLIWYIRFADLMDLVAIPLLYLAGLALFYDLFLRANAAPGLRRAFIILAFLLFFGLGMRVASNSVNAFSTEIRNYSAILPKDTYALIYFFDETLAHIIIYTVRYGLYACLLLLEARYLAAQVSTHPQWLGILIGFLFGLWEVIVFIEGQKVWLAPFLIFGLGAVWVGLWKRSGSSFSRFMKTGPVTAFVGVLLPTLLVGLIAYALVTGGFIEPSKMGY